MIGFFIGIFVGGFFGVAIMCCLNVASEADNRMDEQGDMDVQNAEIVDSELAIEDEEENRDEQ